MSGQREPSGWYCNCKLGNRTHVPRKGSQSQWHPYISTTRETHHCIFHASKALIHGGTCQGLARQSLDMPMLLNQNRGSRQQSKIRRAPLAWGWEHGL